MDKQAKQATKEVLKRKKSGPQGSTSMIDTTNGGGTSSKVREDVLNVEI